MNQAVHEGVEGGRGARHQHASADEGDKGGGRRSLGILLMPCAPPYTLPSSSCHVPCALRPPPNPILLLLPCPLPPLPIPSSSSCHVPPPPPLILPLLPCLPLTHQIVSSLKVNQQHLPGQQAAAAAAAAAKPGLPVAVEPEVVGGTGVVVWGGMWARPPKWRLSKGPGLPNGGFPTNKTCTNACSCTHPT